MSGSACKPLSPGDRAHSADGAGPLAGPSRRSDVSRGRRARHHPNHSLGNELLLPRRPGRSNQPGHGLEPGLRLFRLHRRPAHHGSRLECGRPRHRPVRWARGHDPRHSACLCRPVRPRLRPRPGGVLGGLGVSGPRHAAVPVRRRLRRAGAGRPLTRADGDLLPHAVRRVRLVGFLGGRPRSQRAGRLAPDPCSVRRHKSGGVLAAALVRPGSARED